MFSRNDVCQLRADVIKWIQRLNREEKEDGSGNRKKDRRTGNCTGSCFAGYKDAKPLAQALCEGGLPCAEVTFRTEAAEESIRIMTEAFPQMLVGAGTVLTKAQVDAAVAAGAKFIVSPGFDPEIVDYCLEKQIPVFPGCITPSEIAQAVKRGLRVVKFFPAEQFGGVAAIKALSAPYVGLKFMPTGGVSAANLKDYFGCKSIIACGGSWMVKGDLIAAGKFDEIRQMTAEAVKLAGEIRR